MNTSIIIPCYNARDTIREAIDSALAQTVECEVIVVDDGSNDGSQFIIDEYVTKVKVIHQVNKGLASARNTGIMHAAYEFALFLDSDDKLDPTAVERIEKVFKESDADIVSPSFRTFGQSNENVILMMRPTLEDFKGGNRIGYCSAFRVSDLKQIGGYSPRMTWGYEDLHLTIGLLKLGKKIYTIPEPLWSYRMRPGTMIATAQAHHGELMAQINKDYGF